MAPWADFLYACDSRWWEHHEPIEFEGEKWTHAPIEKNGLYETQHKVAAKYGLRVMPGKHGRGLGTAHINYGGNSGYQAINLAYMFGAGSIVLLGYDMQKTDGQQHWFGDHPEGPMKVDSNYSGWWNDFAKLGSDLARKGVEVINCTRETALTCFRRESLETVFASTLRDAEDGGNIQRLRPVAVA